MANKHKLALVTSDDWQAIYIDGHKFREGHSIHVYEWADLTSKGPYEVSLYSIHNEDFMEEVWMWDFPEELDESRIQEYRVD